MTSRKVQYDDRGKLVYFKIDVKELFGITLEEPGILQALRYAFNVSKSVVPIKTGLMLRSYTFKPISNTTVMCYFDPEKIIGKKRMGRVVTEYYPAYLFRFPSRYNWLDAVIEKFFSELNLSVRKLSKKNQNIDMLGFDIWFLMFLGLMASSKKKERERQLRLKLEREELDRKRKEFQNEKRHPRKKEV